MKTEQLLSRGRGLVRWGELAVEGWSASVAPLSRAFAARRQRELTAAWDRERSRRSLAEEIGTGVAQYSQNDEDEILAGIFEQVGAGHRFFVEIGASDGNENCTRRLAESGWTGVWIEADPLAASQARKVAPAGVATVSVGVTPTNVVPILRQAGVPPSPDLLVLDIDGNDWWVLRSLLQAFSPRVLVVEYNATFRPREWWRLRYRYNRAWDFTFRHGASLEALHDLLDGAGYALVGCDSRGVNAFFVRTDAVPAPLAHRVGPPSAHYTAPWFAPLLYGHTRSRRVFQPMLPLSPEELMKIELLADVDVAPAAPVVGGSPVFVQARVRNGTDVPLTSGPPAGITVGLRYFDDDGAFLQDAAPRTALPCPVRPGHTVLVNVWAPAPATTGRYVLEMTLVQEWTAWFTDLPGVNRSVSTAVEVL